MQNGNADFRLNSSGLGVAVRRVQIVRPGLRADRYPRENGFSLTLFAVPGHNYAIQTSSNLLDWDKLLQQRIAETSTPFVDALATQFPWRWYRAVPQ